MFDSVESLLIVNETEIYILPALYVSLNYCSHNNNYCKFFPWYLFLS